MRSLAHSTSISKLKFILGRPDLLQQIIRKKTPKNKSKSTAATPNLPSESPTEYLTQALLQLKPEASEVEPALEFDSLSKQNEDLTRINELLVREVLRLSNQQKSTNDAVSKILHELVQSRKESQELREQMSQLLKSSPSTFQQTTPFSSNNFPSNQTVPASPVHYSHQSNMNQSPSHFSNGVPSSPAHYSQQSVPPSPLHYSQPSSPSHRSQSVSSGDLPLADIENFHLSNQGCRHSNSVANFQELILFNFSNRSNFSFKLPLKHLPTPQLIKQISLRFHLLFFLMNNNIINSNYLNYIIFLFVHYVSNVKLCFKECCSIALELNG